MRGHDVASDASRFAWLAGQPELDLVVTLDDADNEIYSAFLVEEEGTASTLRACLEVFSGKGMPSSICSDRGSHYFFTPKAGEKVDARIKTQVGRALEQLGIEHIPAYSPEAPGRSERIFGTLQPLPKDLEACRDRDRRHQPIYVRRLPAAANARPQAAGALESAFVIADPALLGRSSVSRKPGSWLATIRSHLSGDAPARQPGSSPLRQAPVKVRGIRTGRSPSSMGPGCWHTTRSPRARRTKGIEDGHVNRFDPAHRGCGFVDGARGVDHKPHKRKKTQTEADN